jgi:hypothetical protein
MPSNKTEIIKSHLITNDDYYAYPNLINQTWEVETHVYSNFWSNYQISYLGFRLGSC